MGDGSERNPHGVLTDEFIEMLAAETYLMIQEKRNDSEIKRIEGVIADNQAAINNLMQALMHGKIANTILAQIEKLENENAELNDTIESEKALQINYSYADIRKWLEHFRTLDYSKTRNRKALIDTFIYRVVLYDDKMKVLFNLKGGQRNELLLNLIFPDYPDNSGGDDENNAKEKETENSVSLSGCSYTPVMVPLTGVEPVRYFYRGILSPLRLPIPPQRLIYFVSLSPLNSPLPLSKGLNLSRAPAKRRSIFAGKGAGTECGCRLRRLCANGSKHSFPRRASAYSTTAAYLLC